MNKSDDDLNFTELLWLVIAALLIALYLMHLQDTHHSAGLQARLTDAKSNLEDARHDREMLLDCLNGQPLFAAGERAPNKCSMESVKTKKQGNQAIRS